MRHHVTVCERISLNKYLAPGFIGPRAATGRIQVLVMVEVKCGLHGGHGGGSGGTGRWDKDRDGGGGRRHRSERGAQQTAHKLELELDVLRTCSERPQLLCTGRVGGLPGVWVRVEDDGGLVTSAKETSAFQSA